MLDHGMKCRREQAIHIFRHFQTAEPFVNCPTPIVTPARDAEDELVSVAEEKDRLAPQVGRASTADGFGCLDGLLQMRVILCPAAGGRPAAGSNAMLWMHCLTG